jgi:prepilin-type N-terminal cleavage/methylation domain-containing protein
MHQFRNQYDSGFTLLELMVVVLLGGTLASITAMGWLRFWEQQHLSAAQDEIFRGMQQAQSKAQSQSATWRFGIRQQSNRPVEWAIYPGAAPTSTTPWQALHPSIRLDPETSTLPSNGVYSTIFNYKGRNSKLLTITLSGQSGSSVKRCVMVSTLLGAVRKSKEQRIPDADGDYCY